MSQANVLSLFPEDARPIPKTETSRFEEFWSAYPKRVGRALARAKYEAIIKGSYRTRTLERDSGQFIEIELEATEDEIIQATKAYARSLVDMNTFKRKVEDKFIPAASVWLNRGSWQDFME